MVLDGSMVRFAGLLVASLLRSVVLVWVGGEDQVEDLMGAVQPVASAGASRRSSTFASVSLRREMEKPRPLREVM